MATKAEQKIREQIEAEIRAQVKAEYQEVDRIVAEAATLARKQKELEEQMAAHLRKRQEVLERGTDASERLRVQLQATDLVSVVKGEGKKVRGGGRKSTIKTEEKKEIVQAVLVELKGAGVEKVSVREFYDLCNEKLNREKTPQDGAFYDKAIAEVGIDSEGERKQKVFLVK